jgi:acetyl esterase/lipase
VRGLLVLCLAFAGCAVPRAHETVFGNRVYREVDGRKLRMDLYLPRGVERPPVIFWVHGGGWKIGDKRVRLLVRDLTRDGFAIASVQYRLSGKALWPAQRDDVLAAIRWVKVHADELGIDGNRLALAGDSAGGHLAALTGLQLGFPTVRGVFAIYPPTDLVSLAEYHDDPASGLIAQLLGAPARERLSEAAAASPVQWVGRQSPPFLLLHGDQDRLVPITQSRDLHRRLRAAGRPSQLFVAEGRTHGFALSAAQLAIARTFLMDVLKPAVLRPPPPAEAAGVF